MALASAQKLLAYLTLGLALLALELSGALAAWATGVMPVALVVSWFWDPSEARAARQRWFWNVVLIGFIVLTAYQIVAGRVPLLRPAVDLVLVLVVAKLFQRSSARDYQQLYALSFLVIAVATVLDDSLHFGVLFLVYLVTFGVGYGLCHIVSQTEAHRRDPGLRIGGRQVGVLAGMSGLLVLMATGFFLVLPRVGIGLGRGAADTPSRLTGFSESIDLSDHGLIGLDERVVLRAVVDKPIAQPYWRGMSFDWFDGRRWSVSPALRARHGLQADDAGVYRVSDREPDVHQIIEQEPLSTDVMFGLSEVVTIAFGESMPTDVWHSVSLDATGALHQSFGGNQQLTYVVDSATRTPSTRSNTETPAWVMRFYSASLLAATPRVRELALRIVGDEQGGAAANTPMEQARAIEHYLSSNYTYTLALPRRGPRPVEDFLFDDPRGHCEFFSSAMVLLLRSIGIPARNVNGFQGGDWNPIGRYYLVRRQHAHSWVEAWIEGLGWVRFDPTPAMSRPSGRPELDKGWTSIFDAYFDELRRVWREWVVNYDLGRQLDLLGGAGVGREGLMAVLRSMLDGLLRHWWRWLALAGWLVLLGWLTQRTRRVGLVVLVGTASTLGLTWLLWEGVPSWPAWLAAGLLPTYLAWRLRWVAVVGMRLGRPSPLARLYGRITKQLEPLPGFDEVGRWGPEHLAEVLRAKGSAPMAEAAGVVSRYAVLRFGPGDPSVAEVRTLSREWASVRRGLRRAMRSGAL